MTENRLEKMGERIDSVIEAQRESYKKGRWKGF